MLAADPRIPLILVVDDLFGRDFSASPNPDRENLCAQFLLEDVTGDSATLASTQVISRPVARAFFVRAQEPRHARIGDSVENDADSVLDLVRSESATRLNRPWALVLLDLCFYTGLITEDSHKKAPGMPSGRLGDDAPSTYFGLELLSKIHTIDSSLPVLILSSKNRGEVSRSFSARGALGFISRDDPEGPELLARALFEHGLIEDATGTMVGSSRSLLLALRSARRRAAYRENILIRGERGTGKELVAKYIHMMSARALPGPERPYLKVNSAVLSSTLFASELFGIEPRTATDVAGRLGLIERAHRGDLFFDEIADMAPEAQAGLLRVLQERTVTRVGGHEEREVDVRFLSATNADLEAPDSGFRHDLLDRLRAGDAIELPPLRERLDDLPLLVERFVREAEARRAGIRRREVAPEAIERLAAYDWPGNVRELKTVIFAAVAAHPDVEHLVPGHLKFGAKRKSAAALETPVKAEAPLDSEIANQDGFKSALAKIASTEFDANGAETWSGRLDEVLAAQARMNAKLLLAAIEATKRRTPDQPEGIVQIHPAVKLLKGNPKLTPQKAGSIIKKLLAPIVGELEGDLLVAYQRALVAQPKNPKKNKARSKQAPDR